MAEAQIHLDNGKKWGQGDPGDKIQIKIPTSRSRDRERKDEARFSVMAGKRLSANDRRRLEYRKNRFRERLVKYEAR